MLRIRGKSMGFLFYFIKNITAAHVILDYKWPQTVTYHN